MLYPFAMFMERMRTLAVQRGYWSMVTMQTWMFLASYEELRAQLLAGCSLITLTQIGYNSFPEMNSKVAQACAFIFRNTAKEGLDNCRE